MQKFYKAIVLLLLLVCSGSVFAEEEMRVDDGQRAKLFAFRDSVFREQARKHLDEQLAYEGDLRSLCSGVKKCLGIDYYPCKVEDQKPWPKVKYNDEYCAPFHEITKRGFKADPSVPLSAEIFARLGRQYRVIYENRGTLPLGENVMSYLFDNMPFTAEMINAYLESNYELKYIHQNRRFFTGSNGRTLSGDFYWALQDSAGQKLGMRNLFFGYGRAKILRWSLRGTAIAYLDMDGVSNRELKYKLTAIVFPSNSVLNSLMQMNLFKSVVNEKIDDIVKDIKKASGSYFSGNKEPLLKSAALKSDENVQYLIDFEKVVNGAPWKLGDFERLQRERAEQAKNSKPIVFDEKKAPVEIKNKGK